MTVDNPVAGRRQPDAGPVERVVRDREALRYAAMERANVAALADLLAPDLRYNHSDASTDTRGEYLERVAKGIFDHGRSSTP